MFGRFSITQGFYKKEVSMNTLYFGDNFEVLREKLDFKEDD